MNVQMDKPIRCLMLFMFLVPYVFMMFWSDISRNETVLIAALSAAASVFGAAVGGVFSGWYSYQAGIRGARENNELIKMNEEEKARKRLLLQLDLTFSKVMTVLQQRIQNKDKEAELGGYIIYDKEWPQHLANISDISEEDTRKIINWFDVLRDIENRYKTENGTIRANSLAAIPEKLFQEVLEIVSKYKEKHKKDNN